MQNVTVFVVTLISETGILTISGFLEKEAALSDAQSTYLDQYSTLA